MSNRYLSVSFIFVISIVSLMVSGCSNPADNVTEAQVSEAQDRPRVSGASGVQYAIDEAGSKIEFIGSKVTGKHDGGFNQFSGVIDLVDKDPTRSSVSVEIDVDSIWSDNNRLTGHLKSPDFFDVEKFPSSTFQSTKIEKTDIGYQVTGNLTLHGVTKSISFPAAIEIGSDQIHVNAEFFIKRFDFGIVYPGRADDLIRDEVVIKLNILGKKAETA